jgi:hypothetical protein
MLGNSMLELSHLALAGEKKDSTPFLMGFPHSVVTLVGGFMLTQSEVKELVEYNPETGDFTWLKYRAHNARAGSKVGSITNMGYMETRVSRKKFLLHRLAWLYMTGSLPKNGIDHINGNPLDNRWANLREATVKQNNINCKIKKSNKCGFKGVCFHNQMKKWRANIRINGVQTHLGLFDTPEKAHQAYCEAAMRVHKEFANFGYQGERQLENHGGAK